MTMRRELIDLRNETKTDVAGVKQGMEGRFEIVNGNMRRYAMQASVVRRVRTSEGMEMLATAAVGGTELAMHSATGGAAIGPALAMTNPPTLMPHPKSLYDLWNEYLNGMGGESLHGFSPLLNEDGSSTSIPGGRWCGIWFATW
jgi:hypothetical protein